MRDHDGIAIDKFKGLWDRGDPENAPLDHFTDCENIVSIGEGFGTRDGIGQHQIVAVPLGNVVRIYNYITQNQNTLLVLTYDGTTGKIYHVTNSTTVVGPVLTITGMQDFGFVPFAGRAYITPFATAIVNGLNIERGMNGEFLYVYKGDGTAARKAGGATPAGTVTVANGAAGYTDAGTHVFGVVGETDTGYLSAPVALSSFATVAGNSVSFTTVPTFTGTFWTKRRIVASKAITSYGGNLLGYQLFFIPTGIINDNTSTTLSNISFYDADLLKDASYLFDNFSEIAAGVGVTLYHSRLILYGEYNNISIARVSAPGEPEAINQINGFLTFPLDGNPLTNAQELRDVLYLFKRNRTGSFIDNGDVPTSWPFTMVDYAIGSPVHGIGTVIDSGSASVDFLFVASYKGFVLFNGRYAIPELSWKIQNRWTGFDKNSFRYIQVLNDPIKNFIYISTPDRKMLIADYTNGLDPKNIKWWPQKFDVQVNTIALVNINDVIIGAEKRLV